MKKVKITAIRKAHYQDLIDKYENPIEHACDLKEGQVFITNGWEKPDGLCDSAWESMSAFVMTLAQNNQKNLQSEDPVGLHLQFRYKHPCLKQKSLQV